MSADRDGDDPAWRFRPAPSFGYAPGLDGVRALAVLAVFIYHMGTASGVDYLPGGFLGVDMFFVLSGYLITSLLLVEIAGRGRVSIKAFYLRRARRLLPALFAMMLAVGAVGVFWLPQQASRLRGDLLASLGYVTNWWLVSQGDSYFGTGNRPDLLTHLWSLAVEEQFYLVWPLLLALIVATGLRRHSTRRYPWLAVLTTLMIVASTLAAILLYHPDGDPSRVYYGTDTRAAAPLIGALLAVILRPWSRHPAAGGPPAPVADQRRRAGRHVRRRSASTAGGGAPGGSMAAATVNRQSASSAETVVIPAARAAGDDAAATLAVHLPGDSAATVVMPVIRPATESPASPRGTAAVRLDANPEETHRSITGPGRAGLWWDLLGLSGLAGLGAIAYGLSDRDPLLYRGGFLAIALLAAAVVASAGHPTSRFGKVLAVPPLRWLGERSYAVYLWHWPVSVLTQPGIDVPLTGWANAALRIAIALTLAELSHWLIERPIRTGSLFRRRARPSLRLATAALLSLLFVGGAALGWQLNTVAAIEQARNPDGVPIGNGPPATLGPVIVASPSAGIARPPRATPVSVAIFGDSQGSALFANRPKNIGKYLTLKNEAINACGIMRGKVVSRTGEKLNLIDACPNWLPTWRSRAASVKADIALVIIGAWDVFDLITPHGTKLIFGTPQWDAQWVAQLRSGVAAIRQSGSQVALAELPCYSPVKIPGGAGFWPERGDDSRTRHINELMRQVADGVHVFTVQPAAAFCTDPKVGADRKNRYDGVHFLGPGAAIYLNALIPQLLTLPS